MAVLDTVVFFTALLYFHPDTLTIRNKHFSKTVAKCVGRKKSLNQKNNVNLFQMFYTEHSLVSYNHIP